MVAPIRVNGPTHFPQFLSNPRNMSIAENAGRDTDQIVPALFADVVVAESRQAALELERSFLVDAYGKSPSMDDEAVEAVGAFGRPKEIRDRLHEFEAAGVEEFVLRFPLSNQREQLRRMAAVLGWWPR